MGRRNREERRQKREDFVTKRSNIKRKNALLAAGILAIIAVIIGYASYTFITMEATGPGIPPGAGKLGDEHEHASMLVRIFGDKFDFSAPAYQVKSAWIHFESSDGNTIHRHASGVTVGYLFENLNMIVNEDCFIFSDGRQFCTNEDYSLKYYINHQSVRSINDYVFEDQDRILVSYGNETQEQITEQLKELDSQIIRE
ncbi:hypothetical protein AAA799O18_00232 [Marine Group I thaumarchaeote SCGC AAA799-O18]|jgi:hypothetical protein|nr:hypothetical protein AAA799O18_00232 [Marine Group I thaumarchaeote SCGC AAA799-O18]